MVERFRAAHGGIERADQGGLVYYEDYERVERELAEARAATEMKEQERAEQWRLRREAEADRDTALAIASAFKAERDEARANEDDGLAWEALAVCQNRATAAEAERDRLAAEVERLTPLAVAYDYLESPVGREMAEAERDILLTAALSVVAATRRYLPPDGISAKECLSLILEATDNPEINPIIERAERTNGDA